MSEVRTFPLGLAEKLLVQSDSNIPRGEEPAMHAKKKTRPGATIHTEEPKPTLRPVGMQAMGPTMYEQLRRALIELDMKLASDN